MVCLSLFSQHISDSGNVFVILEIDYSLTYYKTINQVRCFFAAGCLPSA